VVNSGKTISQDNVSADPKNKHFIPYYYIKWRGLGRPRHMYFKFNYILGRTIKTVDMGLKFCLIATQIKKEYGDAKN